MARARAGDRRAMERLLRLVSGPVYRFGRGFCGDPHAAEDMTQTVLLAVARALRDFRGDASLTTWAYTVARNACTRQRRRRSGAPERFEPLDASAGGAVARTVEDPTGDPHRALERAELARALERAIASLPPAQREVLVLRDIEGLTAPEAGRVLGLGARALKSRLHRARVALRGQLAPWAPASPGSEAAAAHRSARRCPDTARLFSRYVEGELDAAACERLQAHVRGCGDCGATCETLRAALATCRSWRGRRLPGEVKEMIQRALRELAAGARE